MHGKYQVLYSILILNHYCNIRLYRSWNQYYIAARAVWEWWCCNYSGMDSGFLFVQRQCCSWSWTTAWDRLWWCYENYFQCVLQHPLQYKYYCICPLWIKINIKHSNYALLYGKQILLNNYSFLILLLFLLSLISQLWWSYQLD